jgi:hypothetical protein
MRSAFIKSLSSIRSIPRTVNRTRTFATTSTRSFTNNMEKPFEQMEEQIPKVSEPTSAAAPKQEEQDLPKLSPQEFRVYNRMAEHMDMFVCGLSIDFLFYRA